MSLPPPSSSPLPVTVRLLFLAALAGCGASAPDTGLAPLDVTLPGTAAVKVEPWDPQGWIVLVETLQEQQLATTPRRQLLWLGADLQVVKSYQPPDGRFLIDFAVHPSGATTLVEIEPAPGNDFFLRPFKARLIRFLADGSELTFPLDSGIPDPDGPPPFLFSLDRARIVAAGEGALVVMRWWDNSVRAHRVELQDGAFRPLWTTVVEPPANLFPTGIIGGGFDNFHQGDRVGFVYLDLDPTGAASVVVPSTADVLPAHDAFFGENLLSAADPAHFDYGVSIVTRLSPEGKRAFSVLSGLGTDKRLLGIRATADTLYLTGRVRVGRNPPDWDAWVQTFQASTGQPTAERFVDVQGGDMFWDLARLADGSILGVGSTNYTQNPSGLSVSDTRDDLAVIVGRDGTVGKRLTLPAGPPGRGNEITSVRVIAGRWAMFAGVKNAPGTHAQVFSDAFLSLRALDLR